MPGRLGRGVPGGCLGGAWEGCLGGVPGGWWRGTGLTICLLPRLWLVGILGFLGTPGPIPCWVTPLLQQPDEQP